MNFPDDGATPDWPGLIAAAKLDDPLLTFGVTTDYVARGTFGIVYLATPYSKLAVDAAGRWDQQLSLRAWELATRAAADLCARGVSAYSPIGMAADICALSPRIDPLDDAFWIQWCAPLLRAADFVVVPEITGWHTSRGVWRDVSWALERNTPVLVYGGGAWHSL